MPGMDRQDGPAAGCEPEDDIARSRAAGNVEIVDDDLKKMGDKIGKTVARKDAGARAVVRARASMGHIFKTGNL